MRQKYILGSLNICFLIISLAILIIGLITIKPIPTIMILIISILSIIVIILSIKAYLSEKNSIYNIGILLTILVNIISVNKIYELNNNYSYLDNMITPKYQYKEYYIYVKKNTKYSNIEKISNKNIGVLKDNKENVEKVINQKISTNYLEYNNKEELINSFDNNEIQAIVISKKVLNELEKEDKLSNYHKIYTSKIKEAL